MINEKLFNPSSVVVVGGSDDVNKPGGAVLRNLIQSPFRGAKYVVNPKADSKKSLRMSKVIMLLIGIITFALCQFPGGVVMQAADLAMICVAMTAVCLAFSALFSSPDKSNLVSIYLVGFQLPLSGVVLALPEFLKWVCRPFISTYWGWAGYMTTMKDTRIYDAYVMMSEGWNFTPSPEVSIAVLAVQFAVACGFVFYGCRAKKWN